MSLITVTLPHHLRTLASAGSEVQLEVSPPVTIGAVLDALEARYPMLQGTVREHATGQRRAYVRFFAANQDVSHDPPSAPLPDSVVNGAEPFIILGAIAGGAQPQGPRG